jgi:hypothetical protein
MITNTGKNILAKYLVGQTPSYASHIAVGCGPKPIIADGTLGDYSNKTSLDFEMFRVPIISRGFVDEGGVSKVVLTAELPTQERYEITEVGLFSAASNPAAGSFDSKSIYSFAESETWKYSSQGTEIPSIYEPLDDRVVRIIGATAVARTPSGSTITYTTDADHGLPIGTKISISGIIPTAFNIVDATIATVPSSKSFTVTSATSVTAVFVSSGYLINDVETNTISQVYPVFQTNADNKIFTNSDRVDRYERCRFLNNIFAISGNNANISINGSGNLTAETGSNFIQLTNASVDFSKNSPTDELRLAFSVINKIGKVGTTPVAQPKSVRIIVEFSSTGTFKTGKWAIFEAVVDDTTNNFSTNRYFVVSKQLQQLQKSLDFSWSEINSVRIYASVIKEGGTTPSSDFYVCLDGFRLENVTSNNSVYGLTGYSVMKTPEAKTIIKSANTTNYIEFRFGLDVV